MTGLPFVWAFWAGRPTPRTRAWWRSWDAAGQGMARTRRDRSGILRGHPNRIAVAQRYLRENLIFG